MAMYDRQIKSAKRMIAKYGVLSPVTIRQVTTPDPQKPWDTQEVVQTFNAPVVFLPLDNKALASLGMINASEVPKGSLIAYMGQVPYPIDLQTTIEFQGKVLSMNYLDFLCPNGRIILHTMVLGS